MQAISVSLTKPDSRLRLGPGQCQPFTFRVTANARPGEEVMKFFGIRLVPKGMAHES
jgi:hypothetical protein